MIRRAVATVLSIHGLLSGLLALSMWLALNDDRVVSMRGCDGSCLASWGLSFLTLNLLAFVVVAAVSPRRLRARACLGGLLIAVFGLLIGYRDKVGTSLDFGVVADNLAESLSAQSLRVIFNSFKWKLVVPIAALGLAHLIYGLRSATAAPNTAGTDATATDAAPTKSTAANSAAPGLTATDPAAPGATAIPPSDPDPATAAPAGLNRVCWALGACMYALVLAIPVATYDDLTYFLQSALASPYTNAPSPTPYQPGSYPLWHDHFPLSDAAAIGLRSTRNSRPNVLVVAVESFDAGFVEKTTEAGLQYTPVFNRLIQHGVYVENFYANSVQTCKGQFATLFSLLPSLRGKAYRQFADVRCLSLAEILRRQGYETLYFQGYGDLDFDDTRSYLARNGFSAVRRAEDYLTESERREIWGWGPEDRRVYEAFFRYVDRRSLLGAGAKPLFATIATIANHMRFDEVPPDKRQLYREPRSIRQAYANSLRLSDEQLGFLIEELQRRGLLDDTIVIVTSDHAFPLGEHGLTHVEAALYDEAFRIPLLILWEGRLKPRRIAQGAFSQVDIAPTVLDLLRLGDVQHNFVGQSIFADPADHSVFLIQPYGGRHLGVVRPPYKYLLHLRTGQEYLFDLDADPQETVNLATGADAALVATLRGTLAAAMLDQKLLETGEICPEAAR